MGSDPVQPPSTAVINSPIPVWPAIAGFASETGGRATPTPCGAEKAEALPPALRARTSTRIRKPRSGGDSR
jgi:hypothetical protein